MSRIVTLDEFILRAQKEVSSATGELSASSATSASPQNRKQRSQQSCLVNILGVAGSENSSGEVVQKMDLYANEKLIDCLKNSGECAAVASEELEDFVSFQDLKGKESKYLVVFDPLDGSSNIDVNVSVGNDFRDIPPKI